MPASGHEHDRPSGSHDAWLRALEQALAGERPQGEGPPAPGRGAEILKVVVTEAQPAESQTARPAPPPGTRVWDVYRPYLIPAGVVLVLGLLAAKFLASMAGSFFPQYVAPSRQETFDAQWDAHRRGTDLAAPEVLEQVSSKPADEAKP